MNSYGDYFFKFSDVWHIQETNELEFAYLVLESDNEFICEIKAYADAAGKVRFLPFNISVTDVKYGNLNAFADFVIKNLTHARMLRDIGLRLERPINSDGIIDLPSAAA